MSDLLARLIHAGTPADLVGEVAMLLAEQKVLEQRRDGERRRKAKQRADEKASEACHVTSRDVTPCHGTSQDIPDNTSLSLPPLSSPQTPQQTPPTHTHPEGESPRPRKAHRFPKDFPCPDWAEPSVWADLLKNRKTRGLTNTATAHRKFVQAVEVLVDDEWPPGRLLQEIVARGWAGAYDPRETRNDRHGQSPNADPDAWRGSASRSSPPADGFRTELEQLAFGTGRPAHK
ncbi:hypothetical protein [Novosphingobium resinovorum]|uniref:hypothetical protein n=1 Tax=Novosphingobium resinovorum TaxID=158500 RepID=UPI0012EAAA4B|nr:hypothetical protein [Novosphingobium resinovorum]